MGLGKDLIFWKKNSGQQRLSCLATMTIGTEEVGDASMMPWGCFAASGTSALYKVDEKVKNI